MPPVFGALKKMYRYVRTLQQSIPDADVIGIFPVNGSLRPWKGRELLISYENLLYPQPSPDQFLLCWSWAELIANVTQFLSTGSLSDLLKQLQFLCFLILSLSLSPWFILQLLPLLPTPFKILKETGSLSFGVIVPWKLMESTNSSQPVHQPISLQYKATIHC